MGQEARNSSVLKSWKEIAAYLDISVRTCLRYERKYGLPIHRIDQTTKSAIFACKEELNEWLLSRRASNGALAGGDEAVKAGDEASGAGSAADSGGGSSEGQFLGPFSGLKLAFSGPKIAT